MSDSASLRIEIDIWQGEIADLEVDAIIVPASESLFMTGPIGAAVKRRAGDAVEREAVSLGPIGSGGMVVTGGGDLAAPWVIHTVAVGHDLRPDLPRLETAITAALDAVSALGLVRVATAPLGVERGVFPPTEAADALLRVLRRRAPDLGLLRALIVAVTSPADWHAYNAALARVRAGQ